MEDISQRPSLKEIERNVRVVLQQRLERDQALFYLVCAVHCSGIASRSALLSPLFEKFFHAIDTILHGVIGDVYYVVEQNLR